MVLFSLPLYAFDKKKHAKHIEMERTKLISSLSETCRQTPGFVHLCCWVHLQDYITWEYNYIQGYVTVCLSPSGNDISLEFYKPSRPKERIHWMSRKKVFLIKDTVLGEHFNCIGLDNDSIIHRLDLLLDTVPEFDGYKRYYFDRSSYDSIKQYIDFARIINDVKGSLVEKAVWRLDDGSI